MTKLPSIRDRLANALLVWSLLWGLAVATAVWLAAREEVDELLDDTLHASAQVLATLLARQDVQGSSVVSMALPANGHERFAWQVVGADGAVRLRSASAPEAALRATPGAGFSDSQLWRIFGLPLGEDGRMLYAAQTRVERMEAQAEVAASAALAALAVGMLGHIWLRARTRRELLPLQRLSQRLATHEPVDERTTLGAAEREELRAVHLAIDELGYRLSRRLVSERDFAAHAAHALRTPLAGIDAQLAVALRECPATLQPRLQRVREAAGRLQRVVSALLGLFRAGAEPERTAVDLRALLARLPVEGLRVEVGVAAPLDADPDLLAAALLNLLDNAKRYGATEVTVTAPDAVSLRLHDNGPGVPAERREALQKALDTQGYDGYTGLGLLLADRVARAHGGAMRLPACDTGFAVEMRLAPR